MNKLILIMASFFLSGLVSAQDTLRIIGRVIGDTKGYDKVYLVNMDSTKIKDGRFEFNIPYVEGMVPMLYTEYSSKANETTMPMPVVADRPGVLYLDNIHIDEDINKASWKGSESAELYRLYNNEISDSIAIYVGQLQTETDDNKKNNLQAELSRKYSEIVWQLTQKMIADHPESYATAYAVMRLSEQIADVNEIEKMYHGLSPDNQQNKFGLAVSNRLRILQGAIAGKAAVDNFVLADLKGDSVSFDSFRGKYVLVDFWASWCGPCIASFPHLKQLYSKYKDQGFEILGVSVDQKADAWRKAAKEQDLPWTLVLDTKNIAKDFAVNAIPATFLINPEGKIIEAEVGMGGKIDKKLESLFSE